MSSEQEGQVHYHELSPLCQFMYDLLMAGMSRERVLDHAYDFAYERVGGQEVLDLLAERNEETIWTNRTAYMALTAKQVRAASEQIGLSVNMMQTYGSSLVWMRRIRE
jgi:hypothetical protein